MPSEGVSTDESKLKPAEWEAEIDTMPANFGMMPVSDQEFQQLRDLIHQRLGINLTDQKRCLLVGRLQKLVRKHGLNSFAEYYHFLLHEPSGNAVIEMVDHISTNHTAFFREPGHFDYLRMSVLPELRRHHLANHQRTLRIWCAGCASGEEAYSLLITLNEFFGDDYRNWDAGILATDISRRALDEAQAGIYSTERLQDTPEILRGRYFQKLDDSRYVVQTDLRNDVVFRRFNLMNRHFPFKRAFDVIFCRNVMIYFDQPTKIALIKRFAEIMIPGGYLFIGHSESLQRDSCPLQYVLPAVYRKGPA